MTRKLVLAYKSIKYQLCILKAEWYQYPCRNVDPTQGLGFQDVDEL